MLGAPPKQRSALKEWAARVALLFTSLIIAVLIGEALTRLFAPITDRRDNVTLEGEVISDFVTPGLVYRQVSNEYDVLTTITDKGHRAPAVEGNPDVIFIGDSFTFGFGLADDETFVSLYCARTGKQCANLGYPGSGTLRQVERLEQFLGDWDWHPREVKLFFFGMSTSFSAGNDFADNYDRQRRTQSNDIVVAPQESKPGLTEQIIGLQAVLLRHSNLLRLLKFYAGPLLKSMFVADFGDARMAVALDATSTALSRLDALSKQHGFAYQIYLIVPVHDILRDTASDTLHTLNSVAPQSAITTQQLFLDQPTRYYFAFDGHLNAEGNRKLAEFLIHNDASDAR